MINEGDLNSGVGQELHPARSGNLTDNIFHLRSDESYLSRKGAVVVESLEET